MDKTTSEIIEKYEPVRAQKQKAVTLTTIIGIALIVVGIILLVIIPEEEGSLLGLLPILIFIVGGIFIAIAVKTKSKLAKKIFKDIAKAVYDQYFPQRTQLAKGGMELKEILFPGFFASPDKYTISDYLESSWDGIKFKRASYDLKRREVHHSNNGTTVTYETYAKGTMFFFDFEREFGQTVKIMEKGAGNILNNRGLKKVETEYIDFNKKFQIHASDETHVFYLLTPQIQEKIMALEKLYKGQFYMAYIGSDLWVAINDSGASLKFSIRKPLTEEVVTHISRLICTPKIIIDNLGLAKAKFKADAGTKVA